MTKDTAFRSPDLSDNHPFANAAVSFAVDVSGSTQGPILAAEQRFVVNVSSFLAPRSQMLAKILPWNDKARDVRGLSRIESLQPGGYTIPGAIIENSASRLALKESSLWFLLTDGLIDDQHRERFAKLIAQHGLHGTSCVAIIFGSSTKGNPASCNISVGVSVYAVVPNCLFLFYDLSTKQIMVMQSKGIFKSLLGGAEIPVINEQTKWGTFPLLSLEKLSTLIIPPAKKLSEDEIALQGDMVVKFEELWSNKLSEAQIERILSDEDNLTSIVMTAQSRNQAGQFQGWIQLQQMRVEDPHSKPKPDVYDNASTTFRELLSTLRIGGTPSEPMQSRLRRAYAVNMFSFAKQVEAQEEQAQQRSSVINSASSRSSSTISRASALSPTSSYGNNSSQYPAVSAPVPPSQMPWATPSMTAPHSVRPPPSMRGSSYSTPFQPITTPPTPHAAKPTFCSTQFEFLYTPGFKNMNGSFTGNCPICGASNTTMAWLFRAPPTQLATPGFPAVGSLANLAFPLALGNFPEMDVVAPTICCDSCSTFCVSSGSSLDSSVIIGALPIVSYLENMKAYQETLLKVFGRRFVQKYVPQIFLSVLLNMSEVTSLDSNDHDSTYLQAIRWTCNDLIKNSTAPLEPSMSFSLFSQPSQPVPLDMVLRDSFSKMNEVTSSIIRYPLDGFAVVLRAAAIAGVDSSARQRAMFRRYLYFLIESYRGKHLALQEVLQILFSNNLGGAISRPVKLETAAITPATTEWTKNDATSPRTALSISELRGTSFIDDRCYETLRKNEEFRVLEGTASNWVEAATAVFLHAMVRVDTTTVGPEGLDANWARDIIHEIGLAV